MSRSATIVRRSIRVAEAIAPPLAGYLAYRAFFVCAPRNAVRESDAATDFVAARDQLLVNGKRVTTYRWGTGNQTVLLVHGWQGRASQFAPIVRELVSEGFQVVAFDAPAHGASAGRKTDIRDWLDAIAQLQRQYGAFRAIIGHSVGAVASLTAARTIVTTGVVVAIAGAASPAAMLNRFADELRLAPETRHRLKRHFRARVGETEASMIEHYDAAAHPLPPQVELLVIHDREDRRMPDADSLRLHAAHGRRSRMLRTSGLGHSRILTADVVLDAVVALATGGLDAVVLEVSDQIGSER